MFVPVVYSAPMTSLLVSVRIYTSSRGVSHRAVRALEFTRASAIINRKTPRNSACRPGSAWTATVMNYKVIASGNSAGVTLRHVKVSARETALARDVSVNIASPAARAGFARTFYIVRVILRSSSRVFMREAHVPSATVNGDAPTATPKVQQRPKSDSKFSVKMSQCLVSVYSRRIL